MLGKPSSELWAGRREEEFKRNCWTDIRCYTFTGASVERKIRSWQTVWQGKLATNKKEKSKITRRVSFPRFDSQLRYRVAGGHMWSIDISSCSIIIYPDCHENLHDPDTASSKHPAWCELCQLPHKYTSTNNNVASSHVSPVWSAGPVYSYGLRCLLL